MRCTHGSRLRGRHMPEKSPQNRRNEDQWRYEDFSSRMSFSCKG